jgi:cyclopropane-fatty-acyl-phospholipid synthase
MSAPAFDHAQTTDAPTTDDRTDAPPSAPRAPSAAGRLFLWVLGRIGRDWRGPGLVIETPEGQTHAFGPCSGAPSGEPARLVIHDWRMVRRGLTGGDIGLAEGYMAGEWDTPDLARLLIVFADNFERLGRFASGAGLSRAVEWFRHNLGRLNTRRGARRNIVAHYDLGNAFYARWLDRSMTYSSAFWPTPDLSLEEAQEAKYAALADSIDLQPGHRVLEIGCGWGGFAEYAARRGCTVVGLTLSPSQRDFAVARMEAAGLSDRVEIRLRDYRDETQTFDRIVSIEMFEAVGQQWWPTYFRQVRDRLKPGGRAGLQIITIRDDLFAGYRKRVDFIQRYVFPGGMLPSRARLLELAADHDLTFDHERSLGLDYARTLNLWDQRYRRQPSGMDATFDRLWRFYLAYCEAGFATRRTDVLQLALSAPETAG